MRFNMNFFRKAFLPFFHIFERGNTDFREKGTWYFKEFSRKPDCEKGKIPRHIQEVLAFIQERVPFRIYAEEVPLYYIGVASLENPTIKGVGVHKNFGRALFAALMEFIERYTLSEAYNRPDLVCTNADTLRSSGTKFLDPVSNFFKENFSASEQINWIRTHSLDQEKEIFVPTQAILWDYNAKEAGEPFILESNVNGTAAWTSREGTIAFGIYELIERDAFLMHWLKKITPTKVDVTGLRDAEFESLFALAAKHGFEIYVLDITSDIMVPTFMVALADKKARVIHRGFSANLDPVSAIKKALYEAWGNYFINTNFQEQRGMSSGTASHILERYRIWTRPESFEHFEFLLRGPLVPLHGRDENFDELTALKNILDERGLAAYYYAPKNILLEKLGFFAAKVVIPGLIPLYLNEENARSVYRHPRLAGAVKNTFPHPFG